MAQPNWLTKINIFAKKDSEIKELQSKLDQVVDEFKDSASSEVKFYDAEPGSYSGNGYTEIGGIDQVINADTLARIYSTETWVYVAVNAIVQTIGGIPLKLEKRKTINKKITDPETGEEETVKREVWIDASGEKLARRFQYPNKYCSKTEFYSLLLIDLLTAGEYFIYLDSDEDLSLFDDIAQHDDNEDSPFGRLRQLMASDTPVKGMYRIPPAMLQAVPSEGGAPGVAGYHLSSDRGDYGFHPSEIIHGKLPNPMDPNRGLPPLMAAIKPVLLDRYTTEHMIRFYKSGMRLGGVITTDKGLNKEQLSRFQRSMENNYTGRQHHHRTLILPPGMKYEPIEQNPAETALLDFCKYNRDAILSVYKVPPIKAGVLDHANYANARVQLQVFFNDTIKPYLTLIEDSFNLKNSLMPDSMIYRIRFDLSGEEALQEDLTQMAGAAKEMLNAGLSTNEVREKVWKAKPVDGGDKIKSVEDLKNPPAAFPLAMRSAAPKDEKAVEQGDMPAISADVEPTKSTFVDRVNQLTSQFVTQGMPLHLAVPKAIEQAVLEGYEQPKAEQPKAEPAAPTVAKTEEEKLSTTDNADLIPTAIGTEKPKCPKCDKEPCECPSDPEKHDKESEVSDAPKVYAFGMTKEKLDGERKSFLDTTEPMIDKRTAEVVKFFREFRGIVLNRLGANLKQYGMHKARDSEDVDDILKIENYESVIDKYIQDVDKALLDAFKTGYGQTLGTFSFGKENDAAIKALRTYLVTQVKYITDTTQDQLRAVISEAFEQGVSIGEVSKRITEKFDEITAGRANTIARTETLAAVSIGQEEKRADVQKEFPDSKVQKMWVDSGDDRVRDSHQIDGEVVDADEAFSNGLLYPRQEGAPAEEVINCRCTTITFLAEDAEQQASKAAKLIAEGIPQDQAIAIVKALHKS